MRRVLAVAAKAPQPGKVKTRLLPFLAPEDATELYRCFLKDTIALMETVPATDVVISYTPKGAERFFDDIISGRHRLLAQHGRDLGERLHFALTDLLAEGYECAAIMNSDSPTLPHAYLEQTFDLLAAPGDRVVLGPTTDGGYYLIGLKRPHPRLFQDIGWSSDQVLAESMDRAREIGLEVALLPEWYDVDQASDFDRLIRELDSGNPDGGDPPSARPSESSARLDGNGIAVNTRAFISVLNSFGHRAAKARHVDEPD
jgi:rSAM/selenodomain-associated transferase 1